jgi:RNA-directed DNA polymerase
MEKYWPNQQLASRLPYFVVFCESREDAQAAIEDLKVWLAHRGLTLSTEKTCVVHLTEGFDFLGFNIKHYPAPRTSKSGYKLLIKPSKTSVQRMRKKIRQEWMNLRGHNVDQVIQALNPIIRGEANYFRIGVAAESFATLDNWMFQRESRWAKFSHPDKSWAWTRNRYWGRLVHTRQDHWVFGNTHTGSFLWKFKWFHIKRHVLVPGTASNDDPNLKGYWAQRETTKVKDLRPRDQRIARTQAFVCEICGDSLFNGEELHRHHIHGRAQGGMDEEANLVLRHLYCHQQIRRTRETTSDVCDLLEPCAVKVARTVLRGG